MRVILVSYSAQGFAALQAVCERAGHTPVAYVHARSLKPGGPTRSGAGRVIGEIADRIPPGVDLFLPGSKKVLAKTLGGYGADLVICYGFPWKFPPSALRATSLGAINVHTSMLPKYRGPIPVNWAIRNGDPDIGVSIHWMDEEFDSGGILIQESGIVLDDDVLPERIWGAVDEFISRLLPTALERVTEGFPGTAQCAAHASYAGWMEPGFSRIDWQHTRSRIHHQVRAIRFGSSGRSGPTALVAGKWIRVLRTSLEPADGVEVRCADGPLWIVESMPA
ncbi:formyltransferase family protein [Streptomyces scopuliridis]|uniref:Formyltransferase family protein n=1 Tax=Streptomyces scopuliridis TaxID=452529 RepID=A0ACD4ZME2_9ACTN|nr:formyltransferase family protein [Streptomyces scopuliridis]WSC06654.1 formyltransferase family protein [Streptomyces scopuliridis]